MPHGNQFQRALLYWYNDINNCLPASAAWLITSEIDLRTQFLKLTAIGALLLAAGCQTTGTSSGSDQTEAPSPKNPDFAVEMTKFDAQFPSAKASKYENDSLAFNNAKKLDEKGNCHGKSIYPVTIVLLLDASGRVVSSTTDVENAKAACFRAAYANVQFPKPPIAPYRKPIRLK